jgi:NAD(P)H dehydrogenase (quinone)
MSNNKVNILVQGGAGHAGLNIVRSLQHGLKGNDSFSVRAGYTEYHEKNLPLLKELGVESVKLDLTDPSTIQPALQGINCVVILPPYLPNRESLCNRFIDKCSEMGVKHCFLLSIEGAATQAFSWAKQLYEVERKLINSGIKYTILRTSIYQETATMQKQAIKEGSLFLPTGEAKFPPVCVCDIGSFICKVALSKCSIAMNAVYDITGPENLSGHDMARILTGQLGKQVSFVSLSNENFKEKLKSFGYKDFKVESITELLDWYAKGHGRVHNDFSKLMGKEPRKFEEFVEMRKTEFFA